MKRLAIACSIAALLVACGQKETKVTTENATSTTVATSANATSTQALPPGHPDIAAMGASGAMMGGAPAPAPSTGKLTGTVAETMNSGGYTYIKLKTATGQEWVAVNQTTVKVGQTVSVIPNMTMEKFESKTLKRTFDRIIFAMMDNGQAAPSAMPAGMPAGMPSSKEGMAAMHGKMAAGPADTVDVKVPKAEGGKTVAEIWGGKASLKDKEVVVRGKVVKFLPGIMGTNWIHLRDGSGDRAKGDDDLTVTTSATVAVGDVVTVSGVVHTDKDFGAGYAYPVIIENANVQK